MKSKSGFDSKSFIKWSRQPVLPKRWLSFLLKTKTIHIWDFYAPVKYCKTVLNALFLFLTNIVHGKSNTFYFVLYCTNICEYCEEFLKLLWHLPYHFNPRSEKSIQIFANHMHTYNLMTILSHFIFCNSFHWSTRLYWTLFR